VSITVVDGVATIKGLNESRGLDLPGERKKVESVTNEAIIVR
jgi:hypothetical protein